MAAKCVLRKQSGFGWLDVDAETFKEPRVLRGALKSDPFPDLIVVPIDHVMAKIRLDTDDDCIWRSRCGLNANRVREGRQFLVRIEDADDVATVLLNVSGYTLVVLGAAISRSCCHEA